MEIVYYVMPKYVDDWTHVVGKFSDLVSANAYIRSLDVSIQRVGAKGGHYLEVKIFDGKDVVYRRPIMIDGYSRYLDYGAREVLHVFASPVETGSEKE